MTVDGTETGLLCPTGRIDVPTGDHTVELYDPVTDAFSIRQIRVNSNDSWRVRLDR